MDSLGFSSACIEASSPEGSWGLNTVPALNMMYELLQIHRRSQRSLQEQETEQLKSSSALEHLQITNSRLKVSQAVFPIDRFPGRVQIVSKY